MSTADPFDLERFVTAQAPVIATALAELGAGRKRSHWMWFVFPQLRGLGAPRWRPSMASRRWTKLVPISPIRFWDRGSSSAPARFWNSKPDR